jgi:hypothetical protein
MKKIIEAINKYGIVIITPLVLIIFLKTCSTNSKIDKVEDKTEVLNLKIDSLQVELSKEIKIEGLKSEKRMIQSTDRKMLDVERQGEIDKELTKLEN